MKVSGKAPDEITWEGLFGVTEQPLPKPKEPSAEAQYGYADGGDTSEVKEPRASYPAPAQALDEERPQRNAKTRHEHRRLAIDGRPTWVK